ncbi:hypothetical protein [Aquincola sp. J276]|uniref:hypothetical protein n=1 Tax=Aquincola sp. J276 TaxID=2898432 RepID=UPI0021515E4F|nr:hypothetical protein [Aquincola sp. J276]MCR5868947.1 hypothetical protein [Aquincola sp. J276]
MLKEAAWKTASAPRLLCTTALPRVDRHQFAVPDQGERGSTNAVTAGQLLKARPQIACTVRMG